MTKIRQHGALIEAPLCPGCGGDTMALHRMAYGGGPGFTPGSYQEPTVIWLWLCTQPGCDGQIDLTPDHVPPGVEDRYDLKAPGGAWTSRAI